MVRAGLLVVPAIGLVMGGCGGEEWTRSSDTPVCDFDTPPNCSDTVECREADGRVEIKLPQGSFSSGTEGWEWEEDLSGRCGEGPS